ncbi:MAG: substrate-binding domain-containing protein [Tepidisphaeraceae bacterium]|jgi:LacI family transcriptional regulator
MQQIVVESSYGSIWREIMEGIIWFARDRRLAWKINCVTTPELAGTLKLKPDGVICLLRQVQRKLVRQLVASRIPAVNLLREIHPGVPSVMSNNELIGERAADYLHGKGFRRFAFVGVDRVWSDERERGFMRRLAALGETAVRCPISLEVEGLRAVSGAAAHRELQHWLGELPRPAALFACADFVGAAIIESAQRAGISVPEELAILGVDNDLAICDLTPVPLSSIPQNMRRIGFEAARLLDGLMRRRRPVNSPVKIAPREVVVRRSTDFIAIENAQVAAAMRHITTTDAGHLDMKGLLRHVGVSRQWLDRQFREVIGTTPSEEIRRQKLACARSLLLETHLSVQAVAVRSGFTRGENLSRFFREHIGISPREFRRRHGFVE